MLIQKKTAHCYLNKLIHLWAKGEKVTG